MEISLIADAVTVSATQGLGFAKSVLSLSNNIFLHDSSSEQPSSGGGGLLICAAMSPLDALAPPTVKSNRATRVPRTLVHKQRRTRRRSQTGGGPEDGEYSGFFGDGGDGGGGPFGGGSGGGGSKGGNFDNFGWSNWDEPSSSSPADPAFDFVYEVISWIALSNCLQFAFKKVVRMVADGISDPARERVPMRFTPIC